MHLRGGGYTIELKTQENRGLSGARNTALKLIQGTYITFLDSDDVLADGAIDRMLDKAFQYDAEILQGSWFELNCSKDRTGIADNAGNVTYSSHSVDTANEENQLEKEHELWDKREYQTKTYIVLAFITFPLAIGLFMLAPKAVLLLFGDEFAGSVSIIRILCIMIIIKGFGNLLCYQLTMCTGNEKERIPAAFFGSLSNVAMNALLIPSLAGFGAALASVVAETIVNGYQLFKMKKILNIRFDKDTLWKSMLSAATMGAVCIVVGRIELGLPISVVVTVISGGVVYIAMNSILKNIMLHEAVEIVKKKICK